MVDLPDCMIPDGAEPCEGYRNLLARLDETRGKAHDALNRSTSIINHMAAENSALRTRIAELEGRLRALGE